MRKWLFLTLAILVEVTATLSLKAALEAPALYAVVVIGYASAFLCLFQALREGLSLGVGYGIWAACGVARRRGGIGRIYSGRLPQVDARPPCPPLTRTFRSG